MDPPVPTSITVTPQAVEFDALGDTAVLVARVLDQHGAAVSGASVSWSSGSDSVASVSDSGLVTAVGNGATAVTAVAGGAAGQARAVVEQRVASVVVTPDSLSFSALGDTVSLVAEAQDANGAAGSGASVSWSSGSDSVASVSDSGLVTAVGNGATAVTAVAGGAAGQARAVVEQRVASVVVTPDSLSFSALGDTVSLVAEAQDANGAAVSGAAVSWSTGDELVAVVDSTGLVTAVGRGATAVTAVVGGRQGSATVTVRDSDRDALIALYNATNGSSWHRNTNWLSDEPLNSWRGVGTDADGRVTSLSLNNNRLTGSIPSELGNLSNLEYLRLQQNDLTGPIPPELGNLSSLKYLQLDYNDLTGIPPELGNVSSLEQLWLRFNALTGPIPSELGNLSNLGSLFLTRNDLTGSIPPELGNLSSLERLGLHGNPLTGSIPSELGDLSSLEYLSLANSTLTGPIPSELGNLSNLEELLLHENNLTGPIPPELGKLSSLERLDLANNALEGTIPDALTSLTRLRVLTVPLVVCAPKTPAFESWLDGLISHNAIGCGDVLVPPVDESIAYLMQAVSPANYSVPLVAGRAALLRVFVTADNPDSVGMPPVRATFYSGGAAVHIADMLARPETPIPASADEGALAMSANVEIPGSVVTPRLEMVVEIDPDGTLGSSVDVVSRIPETGRTSLDVRATDAFDLTVIPFLWTEDPDSTLLDLTDELSPDHELFELTRKVLPIAGMEVEVHDPVWSSSRAAGDLLDLVRATRVAEGGTGYWMGMARGGGGGILGRAALSGQVSFSVPSGVVIAHELGHNLSLRHAPCGGAKGSDPAYPHERGAIGAWGWDPGTNNRLVNPFSSDVMGYCFSYAWISDYHFAKALNHRASQNAPDEFPVLAVSQRTLLLWGGAEADGNVFLDPAFVIDAPPSLPAAGGGYRVVGEAEDGRVLFSLDFDMQEIADGDGGGGFAMALPVAPSWAGALARITLTGGGRSATLDRGGDEAAVLLRDPETGQVRGLLLDVPVDPAAQADWMTTLRAGNLDVQISRGVPAAEAWQR